MSQTKVLLTLIVILIVASVFGFIVFQQYSQQNTNTNTNTDEIVIDNRMLSEGTVELLPIEDIRNLIDRGEYNEVVYQGSLLVSFGDLSEKEVSEVIYLITDITSNEEGNPDVFVSEESVEELYVALYSIAENINFEAEFRAKAYAEMNRIFQSTGFNASLAIRAFDRFDEGSFIAQYREDEDLSSDESIIYTVMYDLNEEAERLSPDRFNKSWQVWNIANGMAEFPAPTELESAFLEYVENELIELEETQFTNIDSVYQQLWIDQALLTAQVRLSKEYPNDFAINTIEIDTSFNELLQRAQSIEPQDEIARNIEFIIRIAYADFLFDRENTRDKAQTILAPLLLKDTIDAPGVLNWIVTYDPSVESDHLLDRLFEISLESEELESMLKRLGWKYE